MMWILIIASVCYSTTSTLDINPTPQTLNLAPPAPTIQTLEFPTREAIDAFVLQRVIWGPRSETLAVVSPDGTVSRVKKTERTKRVVREVEEHDGFTVEWTPLTGGAS